MGTTINEFKQILVKLSEVFAEKKEYLIEMDSVMGDGDLGITMSKIFKVAADDMKDFDGDTVGQLLMKAGMVMAKAAPSTMGTLMATAFMEAGKKLKEKETLEAGDWILFFDGLQAGIVKRGKTSVGEKTIFDVLSPVYDYVQTLSHDSETLLFRDLTAHAAACLEKTRDMEAQHGKAACFGEKSKGHVDAGATVAFLLIEAIGQYFEDAA